MQIGLLGKANVGKSTFFSAATETLVPTGNFPFTTIQPNVGVAHLATECACRHFKIDHEIPQCSEGTRLVPVKLIDVAGLVPGAHLGKGLGNRFLDDARQARILIHVVDAAGTTDSQGQPVPAGTRNPMEDVKFVQEEFDAWFAEILTREWQRLSKEIEQKSDPAASISRRFSGLGVDEAKVKQVLHETGLFNVGAGRWSRNDLTRFAGELRRHTKPIVIAANKADLTDVEELASRVPPDAIPCSAETELLLGRAARSGVLRYDAAASSFTVITPDITKEQRKALDLADSVLKRLGGTGVQEVLHRAVFDVLKMIVAYPVEDENGLCNRDGTVLPDSLLLEKGSTTMDLASAVHQDLARGFLYGVDCKTRQRISGDHKLQHGDVIRIVSTMGRG